MWCRPPSTGRARTGTCRTQEVRPAYAARSVHVVQAAEHRARDDPAGRAGRGQRAADGAGKRRRQAQAAVGPRRCCSRPRTPGARPPGAAR